MTTINTVQDALTRIELLEAALKPFAEMGRYFQAGNFSGDAGLSLVAVNTPEQPTDFLVYHFRRAASVAKGEAFAPEPETKPIPPKVRVSVEHVNAMVQKFLNWPLPEDFIPDGGILFEPVANKGTPFEHRYNPHGTNLFTAEQARRMILHMISGIEAPQPNAPERFATEDQVPAPFVMENGKIEILRYEPAIPQKVFRGPISITTEGDDFVMKLPANIEFTITPEVIDAGAKALSVPDDSAKWPDDYPPSMVEHHRRMAERVLTAGIERALNPPAQ